MSVEAPVPAKSRDDALPAGRSVAVTGGASGIGRALVDLLSSEGVPVAVLDRDASALERCRVELGPARVHVEPVDVTSPTEVAGALDRSVGALGPLWGLVTCAGIVRDRTLLKMSAEEWHRVLEVNLSGTFFPLQAAAARMKDQQGGRIVAISSIVGLRGGFGQVNYAASKAGIVGLVLSAARELGKYGITVNAIAPGYVRTPMTAQYGEVLEEASKAESPLGIVSEPVDVARSIRYLLSPRAGNLTGVVLRVDGGQALGS